MGLADLNINGLFFLAVFGWVYVTFYEQMPWVIERREREQMELRNDENAQDS